MTADLNFFQNVEKSVCAKALGNNNRIKIPVNKVCPRITRHGRQARIDANEFRSDKALFALGGVICGEALKNKTRCAHGFGIINYSRGGERAHREQHRCQAGNCYGDKQFFHLLPHFRLRFADLLHRRVMLRVKGNRKVQHAGIDFASQHHVVLAGQLQFS